MNAKIYTHDAKVAKEIALPESVFGLKWNPDLVHQVVVGMLANKRAGTANTKTRGEVRGGGKKPWKQKGTGRARHGSTRSPIWRGGGITHGPRAEKNYDQKINSKMKHKALLSTLSAKAKAGELLFVEDFGVKNIKTQVVQKSLLALSKVEGFSYLKGKKHTALVVLPEKSEALVKSMRNISTISYEYAKDLNPVDVLNARYILCLDPEKTIGVFEKRAQKI